MKAFPNFGDSRQTSFCAYCGGKTGTRDHVPSKVLLDEPYPRDLPVVPACPDCNASFSSDEEYLAVLIDCVLAGSANPSAVSRRKISRILRGRPALAKRVDKARSDDALTTFLIEPDRVRTVVTKLARGHAVFEVNEPQLDHPAYLMWRPRPLLSTAELEAFESVPEQSVYPEVGSRALQRHAISGGNHWLEVQAGRYRYLVSVSGGITVRTVLSEYLYCEVIWT